MVENISESFRGQKDIRQVLCTALTKVLPAGTTFNYNNFILHHANNIHTDYHIDNLRLLYVYSVKNKLAGEYKNANSAIHQNGYSEHFRPSGATSDIKAIHVGNTLYTHNLTHVYYY